MTPFNFPEANTNIGAPKDGELDGSQCSSIPGFVGETKGGTLDGSHIIVVAWKPSPEELAELVAGGAVYLTCFGGIPPHTLQTSFHHATNL